MIQNFGRGWEPFKPIFKKARKKLGRYKSHFISSKLSDERKVYIQPYRVFSSHYQPLKYS